MSTNCPNCRIPVAPELTSCPQCGLARDVPTFAKDGSFTGSAFPAVSGSAPLTRTRTISPKVIAIVAGVFVIAIILGVVVAMLVRPGGSPPPQPPALPFPSLTPGPTESPDPAPEGVFGDASVRVGTGTHRVLATTCTGSGIGTAFQFGTDDLLVTSARTISGARSVVIASGDRLVPAMVVKIDAQSGLAILKPEVRLTGHSFVLGTRQLAAGDQVAAIGWTATSQQPARGRSTTVVGEVAEVGVHVESPEGAHIARRMTGEFDPGLAGAPVVGADGHLLGMVIQGAADQKEMFVAGLDVIVDPLLGPSGIPPMLEQCPRAAGPQVVTTVGGTAETSTRTTLGTWFGALNSGDWERARGVLNPALQSAWDRDKLAEEYAGSYHFNLLAQTSGATTTVTWVRLGRDDQPCLREAADIALDQGRITSITSRPETAPCNAG